MSEQKKIFMPKLRQPFDPKEKGDGTIIDWTKKAQEMEAQKKYELEKQELEKLKNPPPPAVPADSPFKVKGEFNFGTIDFMQQQRDLQAKIEDVRTKADEKIANLSKESAHYRDELFAAQNEKSQEVFRLQIEGLMQRIAQNENKPQTSITEEIARVIDLAGALGYQKPVPGVGDPSLQLQMLKLQNDAAREAREFEWRMKQDDWSREAQLERIRMEGRLQSEKLQSEKERNNMLASFPEALGKAIAMGLMSGNVSSSAPVSESPKTGGQASAPAPKYIQAGVGETGEIHCPQCQGVIAIAPESVDAVCAGCGMKVPIKRVALSEQQA